MKYLHHIPLHTLDLTPDEEAYLDEQFSFEAWCSRLYQPSYGIWSAIADFKDSLYELAIDHIAADDDPRHWKGLLERIRNDKKLDVQRAKAFPLDELFHRYGLESRRGQYQCPFHSDTNPSMSIHRKTNRFKCFACNESGDTIDFVQKIGGMDFVDACKLLI